MQRCGWCLSDGINIQYHDEEWGVPVHDDTKLFEMLILEGAQAGLSWITVLRKREHYKKAFMMFDPVRVAAFDDIKIADLVINSGIIRNKLKIKSAVKNAKAFLGVQKEFGSFDTYIWQFVNGTPITNYWSQLEDVPVVSTESQAMSKDLKKRGFTFVGPVICYAYMQAIGMVNDHLVDCFRHREVSLL